MMQLEKKAYTKGFIKEALTRNEYMRLVQNRQYIPPPQYIPLGRTGSEIRFGGPVTEINYGTPVTPYRNPGIAAPGATARRGQIRWEDLPSTRMMMTASGYKMPALNPAKMNAATRAKWDATSTNAYNTVKQRASARRTQTAETAAYNEILKRLNANPQRYGSDAKVNQERARRLASRVASHYKKMPNGEWKAIVNAPAIAKDHEFARNLGNVAVLKQQVAQTAAPSVPKAPPAPVATAKPSAAVATIKKTASSKPNDQCNKQGETKMTKKAQEVQNAYLRGFCKVANAYGVDPEKLLKYAQAPLLPAAEAALKGLWGRVAAKGNRFLELLKGGNKDLKAFKGDWAAQRDALNKAYEEYAAKGKEGIKEWLNKQYALRQEMLKQYKPDLQNEALKVFGARVGTGAAGLVGASALLSGGNNNKHPYAPYPRRYAYGY